jgi:hypothetical protein
MNDLNKVIKTFKFLIKNHKNELAISYYKFIIKALLLEKEYPEECKASGKVLYHYFMYWLPSADKYTSQKTMNEYFEYMYNIFSPIRYTIETFDSVEEIRSSGKW